MKLSTSQLFEIKFEPRSRAGVMLQPLRSVISQGHIFFDTLIKFMSRLAWSVHSSDHFTFFKAVIIKQKSKPSQPENNLFLRSFFSPLVAFSKKLNTPFTVYAHFSHLIHL